MEKTKKTTPQMVRAALKKAGLPYDVHKGGQQWYVFGGDSSEWSSTGLYVYKLDDSTPQEWVDIIKDMAANKGPGY
jgi:hypothetical protein